MKYIKLTVGDSFDNKPVLALLRHLGCSSRIVTKLKQSGGVLVNGSIARTVDLLKKDDCIELSFMDESLPIANPLLNVKIVYDDEDIVVFDKPPFMAVHESLNYHNDTLANFFAFKYPSCTFRAINRLDRNTSGLCLVAKNQLAAANLSSSRGKAPHKTYFAIAAGQLFGEGQIIAPIGRVNDSVIQREVRNDGQYAQTDYKVIECSKSATLLEISLATGRTHQIRVHFSYIGHPLFGDELYGGDTGLIERQALHCGVINFTHPLTREEISVTSALPDDFQRIMKLFEKAKF